IIIVEFGDDRVFRLDHPEIQAFSQSVQSFPVHTDCGGTFGRSLPNIKLHRRIVQNNDEFFLPPILAFEILQNIHDL
ncbi:MAG TPA: hypothetical protein VF260_01015, partial [Bacilli bacterium]